MALLGFDIEISNVFDLRPGEDLDTHAPFDIAAAASAWRHRCSCDDGGWTDLSS